MQQLDQKPVIDLAPDGTPPPMSPLRRLLCVLVGGPLLAIGLYVFTSPRVSGLSLMTGAFMIFGGVILAGSALFPTFSLQKLNRNRWR